MANEACSRQMMVELMAVGNSGTNMEADQSSTTIAPLLDIMEEKCNANKLYNWKEVSPHIFRVPKDLRDVEPDAYEPKHISLGPYHHGKQHLQAMQNLKWQFLDSFLERNHEHGLEHYLTEVKRLEQKARRAYAENFTMSRDKFTEMMVLDACFILELLLKTESFDMKNITTDVKRLIDCIIYDMLILENQVPFFLLKSLLHINSPSRQLNNLVSSLLHKKSVLILSMENAPNNNEFCHILHFFHTLATGIIQNDNKNEELVVSMESFLSPKRQTSEEPHNPLLAALPPSSAENDDDDSDFDSCEVLAIIIGIFVFLCCSLPIIVYIIWSMLSGRDDLPNKEGTIPCAKRLTEAGVHFRVKENPTSMADVTFDKRKRTMEIPKLILSSKTHHIIHNLIALEQSFPAVGTKITDYGYLMDCLIDTADDVAVLKRRQIISNFGDESSVANTFNKINKNVLSDPELSSFAEMYKDIKAHCENKVNYWRAKLMQDYFGNPWPTISVVAAVIIIALTLLQTVYTVLSYVKRN